MGPHPDSTLRDTFRQLPLAARKQALADALRDWLCEIFVFLSPEEITPQQPFIDLGTDSLKAVDFKTLLEQRLGCTLRSTLLFDYPRLDLLVEYLAGDVLAPLAAASAVAVAPVVADTRDMPPAELAIVGMACRLPGGVNTPDDYWQLLAGAKDAITPIPDSRWKSADFHNPDATVPGKITSAFGGFLDDIDQFDAQFFGISPREALQLDPQQRLLLETTWESLENAGISSDALHGHEVGVFVGTRGSEYFDYQAGGDLNRVDAWHATGNALSTAAGRLSFSFGWTGPSLAVDTACSSSLVAFHLACESVRKGESEMALAAGVNLLLSPISSIGTSKAEMLSGDGRCKSFSSRADGYVRSEGCVVVLIKPLAQALADGNHILGVVHGTATNQDGASGGLTVPSGVAQQAVIRKALAAGGVPAAAVDYVEAHGTGTALGDPIEVGALGAVFGAARSAENPLWLGSVKTNIGHTEPVSGLAGLAKVLLALRHQTLPQILHCDELSHYIAWDELPLRPLQSARPWPTGSRPRIAGVSSFGFSGSNAHAVIGEAPARVPAAISPAAPPAALLLPLSARSETSLRTLAGRYLQALEQGQYADLAALCRAAAVGRSHLPWRAAVVFSDRASLLARLREISDGAAVQRSWPGQRRVTFLFSGQGSQYVGMGRQLYAEAPLFRATVDRCCELLAGELPVDLREVMWGARGELLNQTQYTQPALFVFEYAMAELWASWGVTPAAVLGHSVGEYVAACSAGIISLHDALTLIAARGRLIQQLPAGGKMAVLLCSRADAAAAMQGNEASVALAACNSPLQQVISGAAACVDSICRTLAAAGVRSVELPVSHAFHSPLLQPMLADFRTVADGIHYQAAQLAFISNVHGRELGAAEGLDAAYWVQHIVAPVEFERGVQAVASSDIFVEIGPKNTLLALAHACLPHSTATRVSSVSTASDSWAQLLQAAATLYCAGIDLHWPTLAPQASAPLPALPNYPFDRKRFWFEPAAPATPTAPASSGQLPGQRLRSPLARDGHEVFSTRISAQAPAWLAGHRVYGAPVMPAAGWLSIALAAGSEVMPGVALGVTGMSIHTPLTLDDAGVELQTLLSGTAAQRSIKIYSGAGDDWTLHASATLQPAADVVVPSLPALRAACSEPVDVAAFYGNYAALGLDYGPPFRCIEQLQAGEEGAWALLSLPADAAEPGLALHPALLDACFQSLRAARLFDGADGWLPIGVEALQLLPGVTGLGLRVECHSRVRPLQSGASRSVDLYLSDEYGRPLAVVSGLQLVRASQQAFRREDEALEPLFHQLQWQEQELPPAEPGIDAGRDETWLVLANQGELSSELFQILNERGIHYDALYAEDFTTLASLPSILASRLGDGRQHQRVVSLWATADSAWQPAADSVWLNQATLLLVQTLAGLHSAPPLALLSEQLFGALAEQDYATLLRAMLWGLGRTLQLEQPQLHCRLLDVSGGHAASKAEAIYFELTSASNEGQVSHVDGRRRIARLQAAQRDVSRIQLPQQAFDIRVSDYGDLDHLHARPVVRRAPQGSEVEIEVVASALNFKDVLHALGVLAEFSQARGIQHAAQQDFGFEAAGRIVALGPLASGFAIGDEVLVSTPNCLASHVTADQSVVMKKPPSLDWSAAAAIQTVFLTGLYGLEHLAQLQPGERVLIHAAAGGVGQAALQIARARGAEVFVTASSGKWEHLRQQGVQHIMNSRDVAFAEQIMSLTGGAGVDVVLNSLNGEFIPKSLAVLKAGGRFVEIGKKGIWTAAEMQAARPDVQYFTFDMGDVAVAEPQLYGQLQAAIIERYAQGIYTPLAVTEFAVSRVKAAFRHLAQARNIGKVVVSFETAPTPVRPDAAYVITGGLGGLGLLAARWLVDAGARSLALIARSEAGPAAQAVLHELQARADVRVYRADVADAGQLQQAMARITAELPPLAGVLHAAGALADGTLQTQDAARFVSMLAPKVEASWQLHQLTAHLKLDFFVCYSSIVSLLGGLGQANYAAANAFMDALAAHRQALGLPATSINWGPWAEVGMAAGLARQNEARFADMGVRTLSPERGMRCLQQLLGEAPAQMAVLDVSWDKYLQQLPREYDRALFEQLVAVDAGTVNPLQASAIMDSLQAAAAGTRRNLLNDFLLQQLAAVLGFASGSELDARDRLFDLGIDSLLAVSLKTRLESALRVSLPTTLVFDYPTVEAISGWLLAEVLVFEAAASTAVAEVDQGASLALADLADSSEEDIALLLQQALEGSP